MGREVEKGLQGAPRAQLVECATLDLGIVSSSPRGGTDGLKTKKGTSAAPVIFCF